MKPIRHLFWDFDGTLYDSYPRIQQSLESSLQDAGIGDLFSHEELLSLIKINVYHAATVCAQTGHVDVDELMAGYYRYQRLSEHFVPYEGLAECLLALHEAGFCHYLYTHRDAGAVRQLKRDGLWPLFADAVTSDDGFARKPEPDALLEMMRRNALVPEMCAMVGDRDIDIQAGHNAGMSGILFDPDGFYAGFPAELTVKGMDELKSRLLGL